VQTSAAYRHCANLSSLPSLCKPLQPSVTVQISPASRHCANLSSLPSLQIPPASRHCENYSSLPSRANISSPPSTCKSLQPTVNVQISPAHRQCANLSSPPSMCKSLQPTVTVQISAAYRHCANLYGLPSLCQSLQPVTSSLSNPNVLITLINGSQMAVSRRGDSTWLAANVYMK
jgi:hypothetical protein